MITPGDLVVTVADSPGVGVESRKWRATPVKSGRSRNIRLRIGRAIVAVLGVVLVLFGFVVVSPVSAADPTASMTVTKTASATDVQPGDEFGYSISFQ